MTATGPIRTGLRMPPAVEPHALRAVEHPWRSALGTLKESRTVRLASAEAALLVGGVGGILGSLVVLGQSRSATEGDTP